MNKSELIDFIAERADLTKTDSARAIEAFLAGIEQSLLKGEDAVFIGFGTFKVVDRAERTGRNPKTGEPLFIPATKVAKFQPGKKLREALSPKEVQEVQEVKKAPAKKAPAKKK